MHPFRARAAQDDARNYEGDWSIVPLRRKQGATHPLHAIGSDPTCDATEETPVLAASPALRTALDAFRCPLQAARLMRLAPGSIIKEATCPPSRGRCGFSQRLLRLA